MTDTERLISELRTTNAYLRDIRTYAMVIAGIMLLTFLAGVMAVFAASGS